MDHAQLESIPLIRLEGIREITHERPACSIMLDFLVDADTAQPARRSSPNLRIVPIRITEFIQIVAQLESEGVIPALPIDWVHEMGEHYGISLHCFLPPPPKRTLETSDPGHPTADTDEVIEGKADLLAGVVLEDKCGPLRLSVITVLQCLHILVEKSLAPPISQRWFDRTLPPQYRLIARSIPPEKASHAH